MHKKPHNSGLSFRHAVPTLSPPPSVARRLCEAQPTRRGGCHFSHGCGLDIGAPGVGEVDREACRIFRAEQEGAKFTAVDLQPSMDFFRRNNLQTEFFSIGSNQYVVTSIHEHWFSARCVNTTQPGGEGVIIMQIGAYLLVSMYDGSVGSASRAMVAVDQFAWHFNRKTH
ncbi:uncharacterized protein [Aegilops tauschii subsp. strangulata]|uniref:uncharacterized protein isoform X1 n=1 Tax=Aegilops tauschii subsp. strangulata TaxID=200361 RepID=UPI001ABD21B0|nr:uncharacterized protein LOC109759785 isoform X1 [Aegilops tauschii subsp. strangulata]